MFIQRRDKVKIPDAHEPDSSYVSAFRHYKFHVFSFNRWTIKNSETLLRALSTNQPLFTSDKDIESLVNESDQWQSYKRDTVCDAFILKHKSSSRIISQNDIPRTLDVAIRHGSLLRYKYYEVFFERAKHKL